jgi:DnaK suppressor protein
MIQTFDELKIALKRKRALLIESIRSQSLQLRIDEDERELIDQIQGMCRRDEAVTFLDTLTRTLAAVDAALAAMDEGSYGECAECGEPIASKRLTAIPWASNCIRCQEALDHRTSRPELTAHWGAAA